MKNEPTLTRDMAIDEHPAAETLLAYRSEELSADEEETVREHLADCADCAGLILELMVETPAEDVAEPLSELDLERAWQRARPRLRPASRSAPGNWPSVSWPMALAASLLLVLAVPLLFSRSGDPSSKDPVRLVPLNTSRSPETVGPCVALSRGSETRRFLLPVRDQPAGGDYHLEILTADRRLLSTRSLAAPGTGGFVFELSAADLDVGRYLLYLVDRQPREPTLIERYCIEIGGE